MNKGNSLNIKFPILSNTQSKSPRLQLKYFYNFLNNTSNLKYNEKSHLLIDFSKALFEYKFATNFFREQLNNSSIELVIIPIYLIFPNNIHHYNVVIINKKFNKIEFFEPHGKDFIEGTLSNNYKFNVSVTIQNILRFHLNCCSMSFVNANEKCLYGLQFKQTQVFKIKPPKTYGLCVVWCMFIIHLRILNTDFDIRYLVESILHNYKPEHLHDIITKYLDVIENYPLKV